MALSAFPATYGGITIGDLTFVTDPSIYEPLNWIKRYKATKCGGGSLSIQDQGTWMVDDTLHLASGANVVDTEFVASMRALYAQQGETFVLTDWLDNAFTVRLLDFQPPMFGAGSFWRYEMSVRVVSIERLLGEDYVNGE